MVIAGQNCGRRGQRGWQCPAYARPSEIICDLILILKTFKCVGKRWFSLLETEMLKWEKATEGQ